MYRVLTDCSGWSYRWLKWGLPLVVAFVVLLLPASTWAHPLGNFTVNRYSRLELSSSQIQVVYILDMAEIPTFQEIARIDTNHDSTLSSDEITKYTAQQVDLLRSNLHLLINGAPLALDIQDPQFSFLEGQGGLRTLRLSVHFVAALPKGQTVWQAEYRDDNYSERLGWKEIIVKPISGVTLVNSSVSSEDRSQELRKYPQDLLQSPLDVRSATFRFQLGGPVNTSLSSAARQPYQGPAQDQFAALITTNVLSPVGLLITLLLAFGLGAAHALTPGHGKTVVAAYLVGSRGTARHAVFLGLTTTITHTAGVFILGLITLFVSKYILPEQLYPWLGVVSGILVLVIGMTLLRVRLRGLILKRGAQDEHSHDHDLPHTHDHLDGSVHTHSHMPPGTNNSSITWQSLLFLGVSGGLLPCPSALIVLLSAIALGKVGFGLLLIVVFSLGLASVLTGIGVLLVHAGRLFERIPTRGRLFRVLPVVSSMVVVIAGVGITLQALSQTGLLRI